MSVRPRRGHGGGGRRGGPSPMAPPTAGGCGPVHLGVATRRSGGVGRRPPAVARPAPTLAAAPPPRRPPDGVCDAGRGPGVGRPTSLGCRARFISGRGAKLARAHPRGAAGVGRSRSSPVRVPSHSGGGPSARTRRLVRGAARENPVSIKPSCGVDNQTHHVCAAPQTRFTFLLAYCSVDRGGTPSRAPLSYYLPRTSPPPPPPARSHWPPPLCARQRGAGGSRTRRAARVRTGAARRGAAAGACLSSPLPQTGGKAALMCGRRRHTHKAAQLLLCCGTTAQGAEGFQAEVTRPGRGPDLGGGARDPGA
eukprot:scaffold4885_cov309-Prasinococcus_capsulatus_cf.AAC.4